MFKTELSFMRTALCLASILSLGSGWAATVPASSSPVVSADTAARFLRQASWGPTPASIANLQQIGLSKYIDDQFLSPESTIAELADPTKGLGPAQAQFFVNAVSGADQLRQRVAFALSEIWVVSAVKLPVQAIPAYMRMLQHDAFGNYLTIMKDVTLSPGMGQYLDMVNNDKPNLTAGKGANENYAREVLQLFTIGLNELNPDGSLKLDVHHQPIPTYTQDVIEGFANAFTGWTYAPAANTASRVHNPANWLAPMVAFDSNHDTETKLVLNGVTLPAHQTAEKDLDEALQNVFNHPNVGPFISKQLIQHLVTSNPTGAYVHRVASVFDNDGKNVRGNLQAVIKAILLDEEARQGDAAGVSPVGTEGHLQEPVVFVSGLVRALNGSVTAANSLASQASNMGERLFYSPSVFNFFPPDYQISQTLVGPEFQLYSPSTAMVRADFVNSLVFGNLGTGTTVDISRFENLAGNPNAMLDALNLDLLDGHMASDMRQHILTAVNAATGNKQKAQTAIYLIGSSSQYQVER